MYILNCCCFSSFTVPSAAGHMPTPGLGGDAERSAVVQRNTPGQLRTTGKVCDCIHAGLKHYTPYSTHLSSENTLFKSLGPIANISTMVSHGNLYVGFNTRHLILGIIH